MKSVLIADDHPVYLLGLKSLLETQFTQEFKLAGMVADVDELLASLKTAEPDLLLTDFSMPGTQQSDGLHLIQFLRRSYPDMPIVVVSVLSNPAITNMLLKCGVVAVINKQSLGSELVDCLQSLTFDDGKAKKQQAQPATSAKAEILPQAWRLSPKETEVLRLLKLGKTVNQIAQLLHRSKQTISGQKKSAMIKLKLTTDVELFEYLLNANL